ncbi:phosphotransferase family protein [Nocardioides daeguensis]|uniref:Phosphotransferase family protein n=1 Tax=Nocardioides daeguensis TaxID=908359 RepID=A0ABP6VUJ8_9ACTN|nr:phosphotransferase family protein [Nocardioides daeguensis]MBV6729726.1 phosphotransferase family protein [Nocardioides daeguensis]MCR1772461.1 phosphotransferase family protein [Nocardioides daeguensis]
MSSNQTGSSLSAPLEGAAAPGVLGDAELCRLGSWLETQGLRVDANLSAEQIAGGRSNLTYRIDNGPETWVLRRPPAGGATPSAHDVQREYQVTQALGGTDVPMARAIAASNDLTVIGAPFTIVEFVDGEAVRSEADLAALDDLKLVHVVDQLVDSLTRLHAVDPASVGLENLGRPDGYATRQLLRWSGQWDIVGGHATPFTKSAAEEALRRLAMGLPSQTRTSIVHGDYRLDNVLLEPTTGDVLAVVDWELSTLGDPVADVALMGVYRERPLNAILGFEAAWTSDRLPQAEELAERYATRSGSDLPNWEFWMGLSAYKLAVIAAGIDYRWRTGTTAEEGFDQAQHAVEPLMHIALAYALSSSASGERLNEEPAATRRGSGCGSGGGGCGGGGCR